MKGFDLNCDLGEGEPPSRTRNLMRWIDSANIACGGHAGNDESMRRCLRLCRMQKVNAGAHPGFEDPQNFGRIACSLTPRSLEAVLERQVLKLVEMARQEQGMALAHVKLHGALYHVVERSPRLARAYVSFVRDCVSGARIYALPAGAVSKAGASQGVEVWGEIFADRRYRADGSLVPRGHPDAVISDIPTIRRQVETLLQDRGNERVQTICVHADGKNAVRIARALVRMKGKS